MEYLNVVDVYEAASDIGRDLEQLSEKYGQDSIEKLVPKICVVLEQLEQSVVVHDKVNVCRAELQTTTEQLEVSRQERKQTRLRHETELSQLEIDWNQEVSDLKTTIEQLAVENEKLRLRFDSRRSSRSNGIPSQGGQVDDDFVELKTLSSSISLSLVSAGSPKESVSRSKEEERAKIHELEEIRTMLTNALAEVDHQTCDVQVQKKRNKHLQNQARKLMAEKHELTIQLRECMLGIISLEHDIKAMRDGIADGSREATQSLQTNIPEKSSASGSDFQEESAELPRYTLNELRNLINERNQLKVKVMELQDELSTFKPVASLSSSSSVDRNIDTMDEIELDAPVQGPINREPDDKLLSPSRRRAELKESMIRSLFRALFGETPLINQRIFYNRQESIEHLDV